MRQALKTEGSLFNEPLDVKWGQSLVMKKLTFTRYYLTILCYTFP
jgi:hypothetical protein